MKKHTTQEYKHGLGAFLLIPVIFGSIYIADHVGLLAGVAALFGLTWKLTDWLKRTDPTRIQRVYPNQKYPRLKSGTYEVSPSGEVRRVEQ